MHYLLIAFGPIFMLFLSEAAYGAVLADVIQVSKTGQSFVLNKGSLSALKIGEEAYVYLPQANGDLDINQRIIGKVIVSMLRPTTSLWFFKQKGPAFKQLKVQEQVALSPLEELTVGRRDLSIRTNKIYSPEQERENLAGLLKGGEVPLSLELERPSQYYIQDMVKTPKHYTHDFKLTHWEALESGPQKPIEGLNPKAQAAIEQQAKQLKAKAKHHQTTTTFLTELSVTDPEAITEQNLQSVYAEHLRARRDRRVAAQVVKQMAQDKGPLWSGAMHDEELRQFYIKHGIEEEQSRQNGDLTRPFAQHISIFLAGSLNEHAQTEDEQYQGKGMEYGFYYQLPMSHKGHWDIRLSLHKGTQYYGLETGNVKAGQTAFGMGMQWSILAPSYTVGKMLPFLGIGIQRGKADLESNRLVQTYAYDLWVLPQISAGLSYRFKAGDTYRDWLPIGLGLNFSLHYEQVQLKLADSNPDQLPTEYNTNDLKLQTGLAIFF